MGMNLQWKWLCREIRDQRRIWSRTGSKSRAALLSELTTRAESKQTVQYNVRNFAAVKLVTKASQWRTIGVRERRRKGRGALYLRIASFAGKFRAAEFRGSSPLLLHEDNRKAVPFLKFPTTLVVFLRSKCENPEVIIGAPGK
ncbi:hypothetical protein EVAR_3766_1 [Eumeta japonica]|uniref:Uncharacterized protein n=1 Tax=Eumeta variegata TaxID=151549 RepID=A0A4C1SUD9_EUMVA|nr:hypothetical protein EVAR_3766_1 [Eumeta japonica]